MKKKKENRPETVTIYRGDGSVIKKVRKKRLRKALISDLDDQNLMNNLVTWNEHLGVYYSTPYKSKEYEDFLKNEGLYKTNLKSFEIEKISSLKDSIRERRLHFERWINNGVVFCIQKKLVNK